MTRKPRRGFVFYTNAHSRKGNELARNPHVALLFHWKSLRQQIRIEGAVSPVSTAEADAYFASRSRVSRLGAIASDQSRPLAERAIFEARVREAEARYPRGSGRPVYRAELFLPCMERARKPACRWHQHPAAKPRWCAA